MIRPSNRASIRNISDYSPFGVQLAERTISDGYRFGFNSMEKDDEIKGTGNSYTTQFRQNDPRIGRWLSIDPKPEAGISPYSSMDNNPIRYNDVLGLYTEKRAERMAKRGAKNGFFTRVTHNKDAGKRDYGVYYNKRNESNSGNYSATQYDGKFKEIGSKGLVMDTEFQTTLSMSNDINNVLGLGLSVQSELMTYAVAQNYKTATNNYSYSKLTKSQQAWRATNTLGKAGNNLLKATKALGVIGGVYSIGSKSAEIYDKGIENMTVRDGADMTVAVAGTAAAVFMASNPIGWGIGLGCLIYSAGTMIYDASTEK